MLASGVEAFSSGAGAGVPRMIRESITRPRTSSMPSRRPFVPALCSCHASASSRQLSPREFRAERSYCYAVSADAGLFEPLCRDEVGDISRAAPRGHAGRAGRFSMTSMLGLLLGSCTKYSSRYRRQLHDDLLMPMALKSLRQYRLASHHASNFIIPTGFSAAP